MTDGGNDANRHSEFLIAVRPLPSWGNPLRRPMPIPLKEESFMAGKIHFFGHPVHPMLIVFPLGLLPTAVACDVIYRVTRIQTGGTSPTGSLLPAWSVELWPQFSALLIGGRSIAAHARNDWESGILSLTTSCCCSSRSAGGSGAARRTRPPPLPLFWQSSRFLSVLLEAGSVANLSID
jgi:hypothetical protein